MAVITAVPAPTGRIVPSATVATAGFDEASDTGSPELAKTSGATATPPALAGARLANAIVCEPFATVKEVVTSAAFA